MLRTDPEHGEHPRTVRELLCAVISKSRISLRGIVGAGASLSPVLAQADERDVLGGACEARFCRREAALRGLLGSEEAVAEAGAGHEACLRRPGSRTVEAAEQAASAAGRRDAGIPLGLLLGELHAVHKYVGATTVRPVVRPRPGRR